MYDSNKCKLYLVTVWLAVPRWGSELSIPLSYGGVCCLFFHCVCCVGCVHVAPVSYDDQVWDIVGQVVQ